MSDLSEQAGAWREGGVTHFTVVTMGVDLDSVDVLINFMGSITESAVVTGWNAIMYRASSIGRLVGRKANLKIPRGHR